MQTSRWARDEAGKRTEHEEQRNMTSTITGGHIWYFIFHELPRINRYIATTWHQVPQKQLANWSFEENFDPITAIFLHKMHCLRTWYTFRITGRRNSARIDEDRKYWSLLAIKCKRRTVREVERGASRFGPRIWVTTRREGERRRAKQISISDSYNTQEQLH